MSWHQPHRAVGFAVRGKLADIGHGARLFLRLLCAVAAATLRPLRPGARPGVFHRQPVAGPSSRCRACSWASCSALQGYYTLQRYGVAEAVGLLVALCLVRELGPVVTALLFAGRAGTSLTAEIGLMKAGEQLVARWR